MKSILKRIIPLFLLSFLQRWLGYHRIRLARSFGTSAYAPRGLRSGKPRVLFYSPSGLSFGGTEKSLQILAKYLTSEFEVYYMYAPQLSVMRRSYLENTGVHFVEFTFSKKATAIPYTLSDMCPTLPEVLKEYTIDLLITAGAGYPEYPVANLTRMPIVYYNIFGSINPQSNIVNYWCISDYLTKLVRSSLPGREVKTVYIQSEGPDDQADIRGKDLRRTLGIPDDAIVFGRIGRPDDTIFDPIGIEAFRKVSQEYSNAHYLIVTPPPVLRALLQARPIPRVHLLPEHVEDAPLWSGNEERVWTFHSAIDVLAHFRYDGETMGLNIAESMLCSKPIITHRSKFWNAHLEYLDSSCSYVAPVDGVNEYAEYMARFLVHDGKLRAQRMGSMAKIKADKLFFIDNNIAHIRAMCKTIIHNTRTGGSSNAEL